MYVSISAGNHRRCQSRVSVALVYLGALESPRDRSMRWEMVFSNLAWLKVSPDHILNESALRLESPLSTTALRWRYSSQNEGTCTRGKGKRE